MVVTWALEIDAAPWASLAGHLALSSIQPHAEAQPLFCPLKGGGRNLGLVGSSLGQHAANETVPA